MGCGKDFTRGMVRRNGFVSKKKMSDTKHHALVVERVSRRSQSLFGATFHVSSNFFDFSTI